VNTIHPINHKRPQKALQGLELALRVRVRYHTKRPEIKDRATEPKQAKSQIIDLSKVNLKKLINNKDRAKSNNNKDRAKSISF